MDEKYTYKESIETVDNIVTGMATKKVIELHYEDFDLNQNPTNFLLQLKKSIGEILNIPEANVEIISVEAGSVKVNVIIKDYAG